jgi:hypothetical protein
MSKIKVNIPEYVQVKHYKALTILSSLDETEQMVHTIATVCEIPHDDILKWDISSVVNVYGIINGIIAKTGNAFTPIIEWNGVTYGYQNMAKMTLGEYIDIDNLCKDVDKNLTSIIAILYRPLKNNNIKDGKFIVKSTYKALKHDVENIFDYYDVEDYNIETRKQRIAEFESFPLEVALGGLSFFLHSGATLLTNTETYFPNVMETYKTETKKMNKTKQALLRIMVGSLSSTNLLKRPSYTLQETGVSPS